MKAPKTKIIEVNVDDLDEAAWNYKVPGTPEMMDRLIASIERDGSAGVLAVRELEDGRYETIDGNHRLPAIRRLGWKKVRVENFGAISTADAVLISRRRNFQWFDDDLAALGKLLRDEVVASGVTAEELANFLPDKQADIDALIALAGEFKFPEPTPATEKMGGGDMVGLPVVIPKDVLPVFEEARDRVAARLAADGQKLSDNRGIANGQVIELVCAEFISGTGEVAS